MKPETILILVTSVGILVATFFYGRSCSSCPEIKVGSDTVYTNIILHDTISDTLTKEKIKIVKVVEKIHDTITNTDAADSTVCYSFDKKEQDGAYIKVDVCSDSLPEEKPSDLKANIFYVAAPDTTTTISRVDTVTVNKTVPFYKDWKTYLIVTLSLVGGLFLGGR